MLLSDVISERAPIRACVRLLMARFAVGDRDYRRISIPSCSAPPEDAASCWRGKNLLPQTQKHRIGFAEQREAHQSRMMRLLSSAASYALTINDLRPSPRKGLGDPQQQLPDGLDRPHATNRSRRDRNGSCLPNVNDAFHRQDGGGFIKRTHRYPSS